MLGIVATGTLGHAPQGHLATDGSLSAGRTTYGDGRPAFWHMPTLKQL